MESPKGIDSPNITPNNRTPSEFLCNTCCKIYTSRVDLGKHNSVLYFKGVVLLVTGISLIATMILLGRQQKRRPDINSFQRKILLTVLLILAANMIGGILPVSMSLIVITYGYDSPVPWYLQVRFLLHDQFFNFFTPKISV